MMFTSRECVRLRRVVRVALAAAAIACAAREGFAQGPLTGTVVSRQGGQSVANAAVSIDGTSLTAVTNGVGRFRFDAVPAGRTVVVVKAQGFLDLRVPDVQISGANAPLVVVLDPTPNFMEHVQVTATKTELSIGDVAAQADIVARSTIDNRGDQSLVQVVAHVPGAIVSTQLGVFESVQLRGLPRAGNEFTSTLLMVDGVPQVDSRNTARTVGLPIYDAGNVEVVRGPNSALYGRTAIGGSINVRTADPAPVHQGEVDFTGGEFGTAKGLVKASGPLGQWGGYYVSAGKERNSGFYQATSDYRINTSSLFGKITFAPDAKSFGFFSLNNVISDDSTPTNEPIIDGQLLHLSDPRFNRLTSFNIPGPNYHHGETRLTFNYNRQFATWAKLVETFGYRSLRAEFIEDGDVIGSPFDLAPHSVTMLPFNETRHEKIAYQELRLELTPKAGRVKNSLTVGGSYEWTSGTLDQDFIFTDANEDGFTVDYLNPVLPPRSDWLFFHNTPRKYNLGVTGLFFQYIVEPTPRLILTGAGRYDRLALENTRGTGPKAEMTFDAFSPKLSATVKLLGVEPNSPATLNAYGTYAQAFLPPRVPSGLSPANVADQVHPEDFTNYEAGLKGSLMGGRVSFEATYFNMTDEGVVLFQRQGPFFIPTNAGQLKFKGFETGASLSMSSKASAYLNASFYRNRFGDFVIEDPDDPSADISLKGNRFPQSPNYVVNWGVNFKPASVIDATINVKHVSGMVNDNDNTFFLDPYNVVDAGVTYRRGPLRLTLSAHNLFNTEYYWNGDSETADPGAPRQVLFSVSVLVK